MAAHASQATGGGGDRTLAGFIRMPRPLYRRVFGHEWFIQADLTPEQRAHVPFTDPFDTVPGPTTMAEPWPRPWASAACGAGWSARSTGPG